MQVRMTILFSIAKNKTLLVFVFNTCIPFARDDLTEEEYATMKDETLEQIKEFTGTLDRLNKGDVTLNSKISSMRDVGTLFLYRLIGT